MKKYECPPWSSKTPTVPGWYWMRDPDDKAEPMLTAVRLSPCGYGGTTVEIAYAGDDHNDPKEWQTLDRGQDGSLTDGGMMFDGTPEWSGPIVPPGDA